MDLKVAFVIVLLCALAITSTEAGIPRCCIRTTFHISRTVLKKVYKTEWQRSSGACDINALVLHLKDRLKPICAHPRVSQYLIKMDKRKA